MMDNSTALAAAMLMATMLPPDGDRGPRPPASRFKDKDNRTKRRRKRSKAAKASRRKNR